LIIYTVQFNYPDRPNYARLLDVFKHSCKIHMPKVKFIEKRIDPPENETGRELNFKYNSVKLRHWVDFLDNTNENVIFADCDMLCVGAAEKAFKENFDVAYTERTKIKRIPMNGGIMMAKPTEKARKFFHEMLENNDKMFGDIPFHNKYRIKWAGMNQAAFGCTYETSESGAIVYKFKTDIWNAVDCDWPHINKDAIFIHFKSKLRKMVLGAIPAKASYLECIKIWKRYEKEMRKSLLCV